VNPSDLTKALMKLSAFSDRVKSLEKVQRSNTTWHKNGEAPTIPTSPVVPKSSDDGELSFREREYGVTVVPYEYRPLKESEIRILELFPGFRMEPISCRLVETPVGDAGDFEAVSYTRGTEEPNCSIQIKGRSFFVRQNLEAALVEFRAGCLDRMQLRKP
jgi:hypothetical protein